MDRACTDQAPLLIARNGKPTLVMLSLNDFKALDETAHLLRSPANARRLVSAVALLDAGQGSTREVAP